MSLSREDRFRMLPEGPYQPEDRIQALVLGHLGVALAAAGKQCRVGDPEDARSAALEALCRAARNWDGRGTFAGFAAKSVRGAVLNHVNRYVLRKFPKNEKPTHGWADGRPRGWASNLEVGFGDLPEEQDLD